MKEEPINVAYAVVFGCVVVLGLPLNAVSLWILIQRHRLKSPSAVFMINLALADLLLVLSLPMRVHFYSTGTWSLGVFACTSMTMLFRNNIRASAIFITFIGVDRLLAVVFPLSSRHLRNTTNSWRACGLIWIFLMAVNTPEAVYFSRNMYDNNQNTTCFVFPANWTQQKTSIYIQACFVLTLLSVNMFSTSMVSWKLHQLSTSGQMIDNKINVMLIFAMNLVMFVIFFLPFTVAMIVGNVTTIYTTRCLASLNCCFDPLLYYFSLDSFWKKEDNSGSSSVKLQVSKSDLRAGETSGMK